MIVGIAIMRAHFEHFSGAALIVVTVAAAVAGVALLARWPVDSTKSDRLILPLLIVALIAAFSQLPMLDLIWRNWRVAKDAPFYFVSVSLWVILVVAILVVPGRRLRTLLFAVLLLSHAAVGWWFLSNKPGDACDVYIIQKLGVEALLHGTNPFAITFPDIYGPNAHFYPPGIVLEHVVQMPGGPGIARDVQCGYFYLPMSLLLAIPGYLLGDVRYSNLIALEIAGALIAFARPSRVSFLCAIVVVFCPGIFLMLSNAWIEPQMLMLLALAVFLAVRGRHTWALIVLGLLLAEKQYMILALPAFLLILPRRGIKDAVRGLAIVGLTSAIVILPFFFWDPRAFLHSATALYVNLLAHRRDQHSRMAEAALRHSTALAGHCRRRRGGGDRDRDSWPARSGQLCRGCCLRPHRQLSVQHAGVSQLLFSGRGGAGVGPGFRKSYRCQVSYRFD